ncbi:hypothetical protein [Spongorhabdus nitratireducens]
MLLDEYVAYCCQSNAQAPSPFMLKLTADFVAAMQALKETSEQESREYGCHLFLPSAGRQAKISCGSLIRGSTCFVAFNDEPVSQPDHIGTAHVHPSRIAGFSSVPHSYGDIQLAWRFSRIQHKAAHLGVVVSCDKIYLIVIRDVTQPVPDEPPAEVSSLNSHLDSYFQQFGYASRAGYEGLIHTVDLLRQCGMEQKARQKLDDFLLRAPEMGTVIQGVTLSKGLMMANRLHFEFYSGQFPSSDTGEMTLTLGSDPVYSS